MSRQVLVPFVLPANPTQPLEAATKQYVDAQVSSGTLWTPGTTTVIGDTPQPPTVGQPVEAAWGSIMSNTARHYTGTVNTTAIPSGQIGTTAQATLPAGMYLLMYVVLIGGDFDAAFTYNVVVGGSTVFNVIHRGRICSDQIILPIQTFTLSTNVHIEINNQHTGTLNTYADATNHHLDFIRLRTP